MECPYCEYVCDVDNVNCEEDEIHDYECESCGMIFIYRTSITIHYEPEKADCLNGSAHDWHPTFTRPIKYTEGECKVCGLRRKATFEDMQSALDYQKILQMEIMESTDDIDESL